MTGADGAFMPPTKGTSQSLVSNHVLLFTLHLPLVMILHAVTVLYCSVTTWNGHFGFIR